MRTNKNEQEAFDSITKTPETNIAKGSFDKMDSLPNADAGWSNGIHVKYDHHNRCFIVKWK